MTMNHSEDQYFPRVFAWNAWKPHNEILTQLDRIGTLIKRNCCILLRKQNIRCLEILGPMFHLYNQMYTEEGVYPKFNIKGKRYLGTVESGADVKIIIEIGKLTVELDNQTGFCTPSQKIAVKQLQLQSPRCLFDAKCSDDE